MESDTHLLYFTKLSGKSQDFYFLVGIHLKPLFSIQWWYISKKRFIMHSKQWWYIHKKRLRHRAQTIVSWPNPKLWQMGHISNLIMIMKLNTHIITVFIRKLGRLNMHSPVYCMKDRWQNLHNLRHTFDRNTPNHRKKNMTDIYSRISPCSSVRPIWHLSSIYTNGGC